ncbi:MAG: hypothetical protein AAF358_19835 [Pseudomonadota bacterium]
MVLVKLLPLIFMVALHAAVDSEGGMFFHGMQAILFTLVTAPVAFLSSIAWIRGISVARRSGLSVARWESLISKSALVLSTAAILLLQDLYRNLLSTWLTA